MKFPFIEPTTPRYLYIHPETNCVHVLMPIVSGTQIGLDNTCKSVFALQEFFGKTRDIHQRAVLDELTTYKKKIGFDISLIEDNTTIKTQKEERLEQINQYITAVKAVLHSEVLNSLNLVFPEYPSALQESMKKENTNLHSMLLRPTNTDMYLRFIQPVFSIKRAEQSILYDTLLEAYQDIQSIGNAKTRLIAHVLASPAGQNNDFAGIQHALAEQISRELKIEVDFNHTSSNTPLTKALMDEILGCDEEHHATAEEYITGLLSACAPELFNTLNESPFYTRNNAEELSIITQFFLASVNIHCHSHALSTLNFGKICDSSTLLSTEIAAIVLSIHNNISIEDALLDFINEHRHDFGLDRKLTLVERAHIKRRFTQNYTAIQNAPHFDEFILLDDDKNGPFTSHQGSICLPFAEFMQAALPDQVPSDFERICNDFNVLPKDMITPTNPSVHATIDLSVETLVSKIKNEEQLQAVLDKLPQDQKEEIMASPHIKRIQLPKFLEHTARGEQDDAENLLKANLDAQFLLASESFTDYSGRTFHCTAFEYAYWAKDIHMCRMLKSYMDEATKTEMLRRCEDIEENGLTYLQNGEVKKTSHFDLAPLMIALQDYINGYDDWEANENILALQAAWLKIGLQQREIPAHVVQEYCRNDRAFAPIPSFNEPTLPRSVIFFNWLTEREEYWFPFSNHIDSSLGGDFALYRGEERAATSRRWFIGGKSSAAQDRAALKYLDEVRNLQLIGLRDELMTSQLGVGMSF